MKNENVKTRVLQIIAVLLAVSAVIFGLQPLLSPESNLWIRLTTCCASAAQVYIAIYAIGNFRKKSAVFLKIFINLATLSAFFSIIGKSTILQNKFALISMIVQLISFAVLVALTINEDFDNIKFGRTKSLVACAIILAEGITNFCIAFITYPGAYRGGDIFGSLLAIISSEKITLALTLFIAIYAKYEDRKKSKLCK